MVIWLRANSIGAALVSVRFLILMRKNLVLLGLFLALFLAVGPVTAPSLFVRSVQAATADRISQVVINGNQRVENETILSYMQLGQGDAFNDVKIDESIKSLFQTGLFKDVSIVRQGSSLVVSVSENPLINIVNFEGNTEVDDDTLKKEVDTRSSIIFTKARVSSDSQRILAVYQKQGFYDVTVTPKMIRLPENRINLVFEINEGSKTHVVAINFSGNNAIGAGDLEGAIATKTYNRLFFFRRNTTFDPDRLAYDKELLRRYYLKNGFADVQIASGEGRPSSDGSGYVIDFVIEEGPRYSIADVAVNVGDSNLQPEGLRRVVRTGVGDTFDSDKVDSSVEKLTLEASNQGFVFAKVDPKIDHNSDGKTLNITYNISEGPRTYIERIDIIGNDRTHDEVIRRELRLFEGDAYNRTLVERARRRLTALDFFESIDFREQDGSAPDKIVLVVEVKEKSTGSLTFSIGYSTTETIVGQVGLEERNLFGRGQNVKINTQMSFKKQALDFSFTEPYFMGMPVSAGFDAFATRSDNKSASSYSSQQIGGALRLGFNLDEYSSINTKYLLAYRKVKGIDVNSSAPAIIEQQGHDWKSAVSLGFVYDDLDNPIKPTSGLRAELDTEVAGLGGSTYYGSVEGHAWYFIPLLDDKIVVKTEGNFGHIQSFNNRQVPLQDRFFEGADSFRGFASSGIGPKQIGNDGAMDSIGADTYAIGTLEATFPVGIPEEWGIRGEVFSDFGTVFGTKQKSIAHLGTNCPGNGAYVGPCSVLDSMGLRASIGAGVIWQSPFGPLRFEYALPLVKKSFDETEKFRFSIGTSF
jgi:outer membrane protein insertion porin family